MKYRPHAGQFRLVHNRAVFQSTGTRPGSGSFSTGWPRHYTMDEIGVTCAYPGPTFIGWLICLMTRSKNAVPGCIWHHLSPSRKLRWTCHPRWMRQTGIITVPESFGWFVGEGKPEQAGFCSKETGGGVMRIRPESPLVQYFELPSFIDRPWKWCWADGTVSTARSW